ncbi:unnamed protein product, partial [Allacma fusca]
MLEQESE